MGCGLLERWQSYYFPFRLDDRELVNITNKLNHRYSNINVV